MKHTNRFLILAISISTFYVACGKHYAHTPKPKCTCICPFNNLSVCETLEDLKGVADSNTEHLQFWANHREFVQYFRERWEEQIANIVETTIKDYVSRGKLLQGPENLVQKEDWMLSDSTAIPRPVEDDTDLVKNVSSLLEKVEMVENRTKEVEKELKTERRVRRDLEEKVNKTHTSLVFIEDQLQNVSVPVDAMVTQVEMKLYASIEDLNKTIYEDHLKKLYYKVDGVVYKNETKKLDERLENVETELHDQSNSSIVSRLAEDLKNLEENMYLLNSSIGGVVVPRLETLNSSIGDVLMPRLETLETETVRKDAAEVLENKMADLLNETEVFKAALVDVLSSVQDVQNLEKKFQNFSDHLSKSLEVMQRQIESLKNETAAKDIAEESLNESDTEEPSASNVTDGIQTEYPLRNFTGLADTEATVTQNVATETEFGTAAEIESTTELQTFDVVELGTTAEDFTTSGNYGTKTSDRSRMDKYLEDDDFVPCDVPVINDPHLLVDVARNEEGKQTLRFGCRPIGHYVLPPVPVPPRCEKGAWKSPIPSCIRLPTVHYIMALTSKLQKENPCNAGYGEFPDPTNCTRFFKCAPGRFTIVPCPHGLRFNSVLKVCDHPRTTECYSVKSKTIEELLHLTPPIHIAPDNLDRPSSLLATGGRGELIVHPRSTFKLHCLYPDNVFGSPEWKVAYSRPGVKSNALTKKGIGTVVLEVRSAKEDDSGTYSCITPFGPKHDIEVIVKAVTCPAFPEDDHEDIFYRPTPEGELRILGTTAEIQCEEGHKIVAQCMGNGSWSRAFPSKEECTPKKRMNETTWNCPPLDFRKNPDLIVERNAFERIITFKCAGRKRLVGNTFVRCLDEGFWSHTNLPSCKN